MDCQHHDQAQQAKHHELGDFFQAALQTEADDKEAQDHDDGHEQDHFRGVSQHGREDCVHTGGVQTGKAPAQEFPEVVQHPAGDGGVVHHQQITADDAEPTVYVPLAAGFFQGLVSSNSALAAGAAYGQLHGQDRHAHDEQKQQVNQNEQTAAVLSGDVGKFPNVADANGTSGADQNEAKAGFKAFSFHFTPSFSKNKIMLAYKPRKVNHFLFY